MQDPVGVQIVNAIQDLVKQRLYHPTRQLKRLLIGLGGSVELNDVLQRNIRPIARYALYTNISLCVHERLIACYPEVMFSVVKEKPHFAVCMWQENLLQWDHIGVLQFTQQLQGANKNEHTQAHMLRQTSTEHPKYTTSLQPEECLLHKDSSAQNKNSVIVYSPSPCYKPLQRRKTKADILKNVLVALFHAITINGNLSFKASIRIQTH